MTIEELKEKLAAIEHERWADWQKWCHKVLREELRYNDMETNLEEILSRWDKQIKTPYSQLSEKEKDSDREQVDRYWPLIQDFITKEIKQARNKETELLDALYWMYIQYCGNGHYFMNAGETASELLENAGYIVCDGAGVITKDNGDSQERLNKD